MVQNNNRSAFTLAEVLVAVVIGAMILVAVLMIYDRIEAAAAAIENNTGENRTARQVLQLIAEDIDRIIMAESTTKISVQNKYVNGLAAARLEIAKVIYGEKNEEKPFEQIIWQVNYSSEVSKLGLYRSHSGLTMEDKVLDSKKERWETEMFVPVCTDITFFRINALKGDRVYDKWDAQELPDGIEVSISFAEPAKSIDGTLDVPDTQKFTRTIAIDRTRKLRFIIKKQTDAGGG